MLKPMIVVASAAVAAAAFQHAAAQPQPAGAEHVRRIAVHASHYVVDGVRVEGIDALRAAVGYARGPRTIAFDVCGDGAARAWMVAAHRLRHERQRTRIVEAGAAPCAAPRLQPVAAHEAAATAMPSIDDEAAVRYWRALLP